MLGRWEGGASVGGWVGGSEGRVGGIKKEIWRKRAKRAIIIISWCGWRKGGFWWQSIRTIKKTIKRTSKRKLNRKRKRNRTSKNTLWAEIALGHSAMSKSERPTVLKWDRTLKVKNSTIYTINSNQVTVKRHRWFRTATWSSTLSAEGSPSKGKDRTLIPTERTSPHHRPNPPHNPWTAINEHQSL